MEERIRVGDTDPAGPVREPPQRAQTVRSFAETAARVSRNTWMPSLKDQLLVNQPAKLRTGGNRGHGDMPVRASEQRVLKPAVSEDRAQTYLCTVSPVEIAI